MRSWAAVRALRLMSFHDRYKVRLEEGFDHILVVDGVPIIDKSKLEKLLAKISKEFTRKGAAIKPDDISVPWNEKTGKSNGYEPSQSHIFCFIVL